MLRSKVSNVARQIFVAALSERDRAPTPDSVAAGSCRYRARLQLEMDVGRRRFA
jgi:hypothetical protein